MSAIILFDGVCNLCNGAVQFVLKRDNAAKFQFASLQSDFAKAFLTAEHLDGVSSIILWEEGLICTKSTAALRIAKQLDGWWPILYALIVVPRFIRDAVYNWVAKNRYRWFGKADACWVATPALKKRFLE